MPSKPSLSLCTRNHSPRSSSPLVSKGFQNLEKLSPIQLNFWFLHTCIRQAVGQTIALEEKGKSLLRKGEEGDKRACQKLWTMARLKHTARKAVGGKKPTKQPRCERVRNIEKST